MSKLFSFVAAFVLVASFQLLAQPNGQVIESVPYPFPTYDVLPAWMKNEYSEKDYRSAFPSSQLTEWKKIKYISDGLRIVGFVCTPVSEKQKKFPVIVYNRPGVGEAAKIGNENFRTIYEIQKCAENGFIVIASQYRGVGGSEGKDEVGGADVHDVLNLLPIIKNMRQADTTQIFIWGSSRGGSMALQTVKAGFPARAVALVGAVMDWETQLNHNDRVGREYWPDFEKRKQEHIQERSPLAWIDRIPNIPILILHGGDDNSVEPAQALRFGVRMNEAGRLFELKIIANGDHLLTKNRNEKIAMIIDWFKSPRRASIAQMFDRCNKRGGIDYAVATYYSLKKTSPMLYEFAENELNQLGYSYLFGGNAKDAVTVFKLNVDSYPLSASTWESLGEAYERIGNKNQAIVCYQKVLELDSTNKTAEEAIKKIKG